jgi:hypothetical protein
VRLPFTWVKITSKYGGEGFKLAIYSSWPVIKVTISLTVITIIYLHIIYVLHYNSILLPSYSPVVVSHLHIIYVLHYNSILLPSYSPVVVSHLHIIYVLHYNSILLPSYSPVVVSLIDFDGEYISSSFVWTVSFSVVLFHL